ncbi:serine hydrolase domain-containing protein [Streptosporangium sp. NPDC002721]|uniref:serine hydrolase domain-containing protein n=1 Tax=Streptosporangium sp. NPDC002721 TaxID=3366188 RepID=UPI0036B967D3
MRRSLPAITALVLAAALVACGTGPAGPRPRKTADATPYASANTTPDAAATRCAPRLDTAFRAWAAAGFSGSIAILRGGTVECLAAYGTADDATGRPNTPETVFSVGSVTKAFTAAAVFALVEEGRLSLDDRAGEILPELDGAVAGATVRQLLLHTGGLNGSHAKGDHEPLGRDAAVAAIGALEQAFEPGHGYLYSNAGYTLLALIVEKASGRSFRAYLAERILRLPGGRVAGGFWDGEPAVTGPRAVGRLENGTTGHPGGFGGPYWAVEGNGGLAMTMRDLATWTHALFTGRLLSRESAGAVGRPGHDLDGGRSETPGWVAFDESLFGEPFLATAGGGGDIGHNTTVAWVPGQDRVVAMAANRPEVSAEDLLRAVGPALLGGGPLPTPTPAVTAAPRDGGDLAAIVGTYELETGGSFDVSATAGEVTVSATGPDAVAALFPPRELREPGGGPRGHDERVLALLAGRTREGREEREALTASFGPLGDVTLAGTVVGGGEIRTYVTITAGTRRVLGWYSVNERGGVEAAEVPARAPRLTFVAAGNGYYHPDDPAGTGPAVSLSLRDRKLVVSRADGTSTARRTG